MIFFLRLPLPPSTVFFGAAGCYTLSRSHPPNGSLRFNASSTVISLWNILFLPDQVWRSIVGRFVSKTIVDAVASRFWCSGLHSLETIQMLQNALLVLLGSSRYIFQKEKRPTFSWKGVVLDQNMNPPSKNEWLKKAKEKWKDERNNQTPGFELQSPAGRRRGWREVFTTHP